jgi:hypothetical protein
MSRRNRRYFTLARRAPALGRAACWLWARMALVGLRGDRDRLVRRLSKALPPSDREVLAEVAADPGRWERFVDDTAEAFRQGGVGVRADLAVASRPWGFPLNEVTVPTWLWHGAADRDVPIAAARQECLDWVLVWGRRHLERVLAEYVRHDNDQRPHRGVALRPPRRIHSESSAGAAPLARPVRRRDRLGGLMHEYDQAAA